MTPSAPRLAALLAALPLAAAVAAEDAPRAQNPVVVLDTSLGPIKVELFADKAPATVKNFLGYVDEKFYDGTLFHRVLGKPHFERDYLIQGGGYEPGLRPKKAKAPVRNESANGLSNLRGTVALARDPAEPDSGAAQFFINVSDNRFLDRRGDDQPGYCVFGRVIEGMDVVDKIKAVRTRTAGSHRDVPEVDVVIKSVRRAGP